MHTVKLLKAIQANWNCWVSISTWLLFLKAFVYQVIFLTFAMCCQQNTHLSINETRFTDPHAQSEGFPLHSGFRSYLDMVKVFVFSYFFWLVLCLIFITGTTRINIFCLGYLVACFYFMLFGGSVLMQPVRYILRLWDWLIGYTCFVIAMKNLLSVSDRPVVELVFRVCFE